MTPKMAQSPPNQDSKPCLEFTFSWESELEDPSKYRAFCFDEVCPSCRAQRIEIFLDRILYRWEPALISELLEEELDKESAEFGMGLTMLRIDQLVLHELMHWADCDEDQVEYLLDGGSLDDIL